VPDHYWCPDCRMDHAGPRLPTWTCRDDAHGCAITVRACGPGGAAKLAAELWDDDGDHCPNERTICVTGADGEATTFTVTAETVRNYGAREVSDG